MKFLTNKDKLKELEQRITELEESIDIINKGHLRIAYTVRETKKTREDEYLKMVRLQRDIVEVMQGLEERVKDLEDSE